MRHLRYFDVLSQELHFAKAAARLRSAQPAHSDQNLEHELGTWAVPGRRVEFAAGHLRLA
ncbi:LysR family transcriptional regulator [Afipia sp. GAS231]|uniref:LysR family transcriptional regulator n=1 Tax=Afipia sp. GAS231 TaxID=1882747 RepID=UPI003529E3D5